jgi:hypothetical protein
MSATLARIERVSWADGVALSRGLPAYGSASAFIGTDLDGLSDCLAPEQWDETRRELQAALRAIKPKREVAVLAMARDEALHLPEWIAHHLSIGVDHLFVYTNDNRDGTDELLRWFSQNAPVTPLFTTAAVGVDIQRKNYQHAFFLLPELRLFEWVLVVDVDEFLVPAAGYDHRLPTLLDEAPEDAAAIVFPWAWRLYDRALERTPGLLAERFEHALPHALFKSVVRLKHATSLCQIHVPTLDAGARILDSSFAPLDPNEIWSGSRKSAAGGWIDHYWGRSFEEFVIKKTRGDSLAIPDGQFQRAYETFFSWTAPCTDGNRAPVPESMLASIRTKLAHFDRDPDYRALTEKAAAFYDRHAAALKGDLPLIELYEKLRREITPGLSAAP